MSAIRFLRYSTAVLAFGLGAVVFASDPDAPKKEERLRLRLVQLEQERLLLAQKQKGQPKANQKPLPIPRLPVGAMPDGAIARLGDSRLRHAAPAKCITFSPDGKRILTGGEDGTLRLWDTATGDPVSALSLGYTPTGIHYTHGGTRIAVAVADSLIRFLEPDTLKQVATFQAGNGSDVAVSADGKMIATRGANEQLIVTELASELPKLELPFESPSPAHYAFHPNNKMIAVAGRSGSITLYKLAGGKPVLSLNHGGPVNGLAFSPDGKRLATGGTTPVEVVKVWDLGALKDGKIEKPVAEISGASRPQAWFVADRLGAGSSEGAGVYDLSEKKWVGFAKGVAGEWAVSPDGSRIAATGNNALRVRVWDLASGKQLHSDNDTFPDAALLLPSGDGKSIFVIAGDAAFNWKTDQREAEPAGLLPGKTIGAAVGDQRLAVALPQWIAVYDVFDPAKPLPAKPSRTIPVLIAAARAVAVSPDGKFVAYSNEDQKIVIADASTGKTLRVLPKETIGLALAFSPDGRKLAVLGRDAFLRLWPVELAKNATEDSDLWRIRMQRGSRGSITFSPDGKFVAASSSTLLLVAEAVTGEKLFDIDRRDFDDGLFQQVVFSPDSRLLITGSAGITGAVQVFEVATHSLVRRFTTGMGAINKLNVFPDGTRAVSAGAEEVITVWDLSLRHGKAAPTAEELAAAWANLDSLDAAKGYPASRTLVAGGAKAVRVVAAGVESSLATHKQVAQWVKDLASEDFAEREAATKALLAHDYLALAPVQAAAASESQEARTRATDILNKLTAKGITLPAHGLAGDTLRFVRAIQVLEDIGGAEAHAALEKLSQIGGRVGDDAKAALARTKK